MEEKQREGNHRLQMRERSQGCVTGVKDVVAFDEGEMFVDGAPTFQYDENDWEELRARACLQSKEKNSM